MKKIIKFHNEPQEFSIWKESNRRFKYSDLRTPVKTVLKMSLLKEQKNLCCYCGMNLTDVESHIEHVIPQHTRTHGLDYRNMHVSCNGDNPRGLRDGRGELEYCGMHKGEKILSVTPTQEDCESRFKYSIDGSVKAMDSSDEDAVKSIEVLNLNTIILKDMRKAVIEALIMPIISSDSTQEEITLELNDVITMLDNIYEDGLLSYSFQVKQIIESEYI